MILLITTLAIAGLIGYYFLMFKPKQDAKISKKTKGQGSLVKNIIIDKEYPS